MEERRGKLAMWENVDLKIGVTSTYENPPM